MSLSLSHRFSPPERPRQPLFGGLSLALSRVHEFCGPARVALAALLVGAMRGPVVWIAPGWLPERLYPDGLMPIADPGRLVLAQARRPEDLLWAAEESLRSGAVPLVLVEVPHPPGLTPVRRLHLAAQAGSENAYHAGRDPVLGVILTPGSGGAAGVESRWQMDYAPSPSTLIEMGAAWHLRRVRSRMEPEAAWRVVRDSRGTMRMEGI